MLVLLVILVILLLFLLLKVGLVAEYGDVGFSVYLKVLFFKINLFGKKKKTEIQPKEKPKEKRKFGDLETLKEIVSPILKMLGKLIHMLSINRLTLDLKIATGDAFSTALLYGGAWAGIGMIFPALDNNIKIKKKSISINADFENTESTAYMYADVSLRVWQILILGIYLIFQYIRKQKGFEENGGTRT